MTTADIILRLITALILGGLVGYERQARSKAAGLRTHILVSMGACLYMMISMMVPLQMDSSYGLTGDGGRIAAQVVSGVGFLGAGSILAAKGGHKIFGLTTAASIWAVAAVGLAAGMGLILMATITAILILITLTGLYHLDMYINRKQSAQSCELLLLANPEKFSKEHLRTYLQQKELSLSAFTEAPISSGRTEIHLTFAEGQLLDAHDIMPDLMLLPGVTHISIVKE